MALIRDEAIILQGFPYSETSRVFRLLTREHGVRSAIARGAQRPGSRYTAVLEIFTLGIATLQIRDGRDLHTLSGFELVRTGHGLGRDLIRFGAASLLAETVIRSGTEDSDPGLFAVVLKGLRRLESVPRANAEVAALSAVWALIHQLGFAPILDACAGCGREIPDSVDTAFDAAAGGMLCEHCGPAATTRLPAQARIAMRALVNGEIPPLDQTRGHWILLSRFLTYHVLDGQAPRSLAFLAEIVGST